MAVHLDETLAGHKLRADRIKHRQLPHTLRLELVWGAKINDRMSEIAGDECVTQCEAILLNENVEGLKLLSQRLFQCGIVQKPARARANTPHQIAKEWRKPAAHRIDETTGNRVFILNRANSCGRQAVCPGCLEDDDDEDHHRQRKHGRKKPQSPADTLSKAHGPCCSGRADHKSIRRLHQAGDRK
jgi:hypothetical protein